MSKMFDKKEIKKHIGEEVKFRDRLNALKPVEDYFLAKCKKVGIESSYDCTADENTYFKTINYTSYAGLFIMHPLSFGQQIFQMYDAKADRLNSAGHVEWLEDNLKRKEAGKYVKSDGSELSELADRDVEAVAVLAGSNKFFEHTSKVKFERIIKRHGNKLVLKPHPITNTDVLGQIFNMKGEAYMASRTDDLYSIMQKASTVYTTHISETALTALLLGKKISPLEPFNRRLTGSFFHINHFCFSEPEPVDTIKSIFASPKSGVVHPEVDGDWKAKVDEYFDYVMAKRRLQKGHYYQ